MSKKPELAVGHGLPRGARERAGDCETHPWGEIVEAAPTVEREELVVRRRADLAAEPCSQSEHRLRSRSERPRHRSRLQAPRLLVDREHAEPASPLELADRPVDALVRQIHARIARKAARLTQVRKDRP